MAGGIFQEFVFLILGSQVLDTLRLFITEHAISEIYVLVENTERSNCTNFTTLAYFSLQLIYTYRTSAMSLNAD